MIKFSTGVFGGMFIFALSAQGFGLLLVAAVAVSFLGKMVGENDLALWIYIISAMAISYAVPILAAIVEKNFWLLLIIPFITSFIFAIPSSFVANYGCEAGKERAIYAMKAVPVVMGVYLIFGKDEEKLDCHSWVGTP